MKICIEDTAQGSYTVTDETNEEASEANEESGGMMQGGAPMQAEQQPQGQQAASLQEALQLVVQMFKSQQGGQKPSPFDQGFQQGLNPPGQMQ
jgi:hypothetical protein